MPMLGVGSIMSTYTVVQTYLKICSAYLIDVQGTWLLNHSVLLDKLLAMGFGGCD